ncbi:MAG: N-acetylmuramoyl-L-alanine amidase [Bryobacteraceae bacterium]
MEKNTIEPGKATMRQALIWSLLVLTVTSVSAAARAETLVVTAVRFWSLSDVTRVAIETNGAFRYRSDKLNKPERIFFDLLGTTPRMGRRGIHTTNVGDRLLKRIRVAETQPGMTRVVFDLESSVEFTASQLTNPERLMIELRAAKSPAGTLPPISSRRSVSGSDKLVEPSTPIADPGPAIVARASEFLAKIDAAPILPPAAIPPPPPDLKSSRSLAATGAKRNSSGNRTLIRALGLKVGRIVIDPGHGGYDHGTTGDGGLMEKEVVLDVAKRLGALVEERLGSEVVYTRGDDTFIPLETRTEIANRNKADLFLSIHANSSPYPSVSGVETYYLNFSASREAMDLASRENAGSRKSIHELTDIIQKITRHDKAEESREFANRMQTALHGAVSRANPAAKNRGVKKAPFVVLIGASMPSILAEIGFVTHPKEESLLKRPDHRQKLAEALYRGLERYAETLSHFQIAAAKD